MCEINVEYKTCKEFNKLDDNVKEIYLQKRQQLREIGDVRVNLFTSEYIVKDFGSFEEFDKLDDNVKRIILQLYHERDLDNNIQMNSNWARKFNCTNSYKLVHDISKYDLKKDEDCCATKSYYNFIMRSNELNVNEINHDEIVNYLKNNNYYYYEDDEEDFTFKKLYEMAEKSSGYIKIV